MQIAPFSLILFLDIKTRAPEMQAMLFFVISPPSQLHPPPPTPHPPLHLSPELILINIYYTG